MSRFQWEVSKVWKHINGSTASIFGACPYTSEDDKKNWSMVEVGYTIRDNKRNTVGLGIKPFKSKYDAVVVVCNLNLLVQQGKPPVYDPSWLIG